MKKNLCSLCIVGIVFSMLTGCGAGKNFENTAGASGASVSGASVSGASVSGQAVADGGKENMMLAPEKYPFCSDNSLYRATDYGILEQRSMEGRLVKQYKLEGLTNVLHVTKDEVFYSYDNVPGIGGDEIWSVPIQKENLIDQLQVEKAKRVLKDKGNIYPNLYADKNVILYTSDNDDYIPKRYDRKTGKVSRIKNRKGKISLTFFNQNDYLIPCGNAVFMTGTYKESESGGYGLYVYFPYAGKWKTIDAMSSAENAQAASDGERVYYMISDEDQPFRWRTTGDIWAYTPETQKKEKILSKEELERLSRENALNADIDTEMEIYFDRGQLYLCTTPDDDNDETAIVFRYDLEKRKLVYEKKLSQWLTENDYSYKLCFILQGKCILYDLFVCYDLVTGETKKLDEKDKEYYYPDWYGTLRGIEAARLRQ